MVTWAEDINLDRICEGINKYISKYKMKDYYVYGLQQEDRPHVRLSPSCPDELKELFEKSDYVLDVKAATERYCSDCDRQHSVNDCHCNSTCYFCNPNIISIGIRRDVRSDIDSCRKLIKTIVFAMEKKLILGKDAKLNLGRRVSREVPKIKVRIEEEKGHVLALVNPAGLYPVSTWDQVLNTVNSFNTEEENQ